MRPAPTGGPSTPGRAGAGWCGAAGLGTVPRVRGPGWGTDAVPIGKHRWPQTSGTRDPGLGERRALRLGHGSGGLTLGSAAALSQALGVKRPLPELICTSKPVRARRGAGPEPFEPRAGALRCRTPWSSLLYLGHIWGLSKAGTYDGDVKPALQVERTMLRELKSSS